MVPVEVDGNNSRVFLFDIFDDRKMMILNPFHSHMHNLGGDVVTLEEVSQSEESHGQKVDPNKIIDRPVVIIQLGDMEKNTVKSSHWGNCKMSTGYISTSLQKKSHGAWRIAQSAEGIAIWKHQITNTK
jgi:hypothetical protein